MALEPIRSRTGDTLDAAVWRERGLGPADLGPLLVINPGLAALGPVLPAGTIILVPAAAPPAPPTLDLVQLWD
jgi:phage tail protein X